MNFLIVSISPDSNPEESALPKSLIGFDHSIEIWLAEVARVSRPPVVPRGNGFAKRKGGRRNVVQLVPLLLSEFFRIIMLRIAVAVLNGGLSYNG
jgi:hypothetical protein